jgi:hypothetical protein
MFAAWMSILGVARAQTEVCGDIFDQTWTLAGSPYVVVCNVTAGGLTIQPGVQVIFQSNYVFEVEGQLTAVGTAAAPIVFTGTNGGWQGIYFYDAPPPASLLAYCSISNAVNSGIRITNTSVVISNCLIASNTSPANGGGILAVTAANNLVLQNCTLINNTCGFSGGGICALIGTNTLTMTECVVSNNFANPSKNVGTYYGGGVYVSGNSLLKNCVVRDNTCQGDSEYAQFQYAVGGGLYSTTGTATIENCIFAANTAVCGNIASAGAWSAWGGGIYIDVSGSLAMTNSILFSNVTSSSYGEYGAGLGISSSVTKCSVVNCTFAYNNTQGIYSGGTAPQVMNSILFFNDGNGTQISGPTNVTYCDVQGGFAGVGNINYNPFFLNTTNYTIAPVSSCVDAGNPATNYNDVCFPPSLGTVTNDMGAYGGPGACGWLPPPIPVSPIPNTNINELVLWQYTPTVSGSGHTFGLSNAPSGMTVNTNSGTISWTPSQQQATYTFSNITFIVYQSAVPVASASFNVTVNDTNVPPILYVPGQQLVYLGSTMTVTNTATLGDIWAEALGLALVSAPSGVVLQQPPIVDTNALVFTLLGVLTWTPTPSQSPSTNTICVSVTDYDPDATNSQNVSVTNCFTVVVINPTVSISATSPNASDLGPTNGVFTVTRSGGTNGSLSVYYNVSGTASNGVDYLTLTNPVVIPAGALSTTVAITPILYSSAATSCTVALTLSANSSYDFGSPNTASVTITQIPPPTLIVPTNQIYIYLGSNLTVTCSVTDPYIPSNQFAFTNVSSPLGVILNPATGVLTWTPANTGTNIITIEVYDTNAPGYEATSNFTVVVTKPGYPPTNVTISPLSQTVFEGATATFSALAGGTVPFAYQWYFTNTPIAGATNSTLTLTDVQLTNAGSYMVVLNNPYGVATNLDDAILNVLTFTATHTSPAYGSPGICVVSCQVNYALDRTNIDLLLDPALPAGWTLQSVSGEGNPYIDSGDIKFAAVNLPNPVIFTYTAAVPAGQSEPQSITDTADYLLSGMTFNSYYPATPNPLIVVHGAFVTLSVSNNQLSLNLFGDSGSNYVLQASTDLVNWSDLATIVPINGVYQTNEPITGTQTFYRTMLGH